MTVFDKVFFEDLFKLYLSNEEVLRQKKKDVKPLSCYRKYLQTLPPNYVFSFPNTVILKLTEACNLRCRHCFYAEQPEYYNKILELNTEEIIELINFLVDEINILSITLTGGEVFVRQDFIHILKHIKSKNLIVTIQTNGTLINEEKANQLGKILNLKTDSIQISLDGIDKTSHETIRGKNTFDKTINAIKLLRKNQIKVQINTTLTTVSAPNIQDIFELCEELDVNTFSINKYEVCDEKQLYLKLSTDKLLEYSYKLLNKVKYFKNINMIYKPLDIFDFLRYPEGRVVLENYIEDNNLQASQNKCLSCHNHNKMTISSEGKIFFCSMDESEEAILGSLRKNSFYEIWENRFNTPYFQKRDMTTTKCKNFKYIPICNTGCMASAYKKYRDINCATADCCYFEEYMKGQNG